MRKTGMEKLKKINFNKIIWVFSSNWKEKKKGVKNKKKRVQTLKWATAHLRIRRGAQARRWGAGALGH